MPWRARTVVQRRGARRASRPQLNRDSLGGITPSTTSGNMSSVRTAILLLAAYATAHCHRPPPAVMPAPATRPDTGRWIRIRGCNDCPLPAAVLTGTVTDSAGRPLRAVVAQVLEGGILTSSRSAWTDSTGTYVFPALPPGVIRLVVLAIDYAPARRDSVRLSPGTTLRVDFRLRPQVWCDIGCDGVIVPHARPEESH